MSRHVERVSDTRRPRLPTVLEMALILAIRDKAGQWHGDPDGKAHGVRNPPPLTSLEFFPQAGEPGQNSPFAGQTLQVLVANTGDAGCPGQVCYQVGNGRMHYATEEVDQLLFGADVHDAWNAGRWPPKRQRPTLASIGEAPTPAGRCKESGTSPKQPHVDRTRDAEVNGIAIEAVGADNDAQIKTRMARQSAANVPQQ
ncbi:hypothetical protein GCM10010109_65630 [Actinoplanes campanulatus]|nr:hypothetical protein GCM10010109_65630 [Actinoplanes campanulatus]GID39591.1 hypothetical protein Aca09nite_60970 [Actinoplanes campanulatus]